MRASRSGRWCSTDQSQETPSDAGGGEHGVRVGQGGGLVSACRGAGLWSAGLGRSRWRAARLVCASRAQTAHSRIAPSGQRQRNRIWRLFFRPALKCLPVATDPLAGHGAATEVGVSIRLLYWPTSSETAAGGETRRRVKVDAMVLTRPRADIPPACLDVSGADAARLPSVGVVLWPARRGKPGGAARNGAASRLPSGDAVAIWSSKPETGHLGGMT